MNDIRMTSAQLNQLGGIMQASTDETAIFLLAGVFKTKSGIHFTVKRIITPKENEYDSRSSVHIEVSPLFFNKVISLAEANNVTIIQCHSHPGADYLQYSVTDNRGESASAKTIQDNTGKPMGSLLFGREKIIGRAWLTPKNNEPIHEIRIVDRHYRKKILVKQNKQKQIDEEIYDRQILAFGLRGQELLSHLKIGIVGLGGTGSATAEQLAREGIEDFVLMEHDIFELSNKTKLYGSYHNDSGPKTKIIKRNIKKINPNASVELIQKKLESENDLELLSDCDIVFGCTDRHTPRALLTILAHAYSIPVIDVGVGLDAENEMIIGGHARATLVAPSLPCLYCIGVINSDTILAESMPEKDRQSMEEHGYIQGLDNDVPAVIPFTTQAACMGVTLLKDILFKLLRTEANTLILDVVSFESSKLTATSKPDCVCLARQGKCRYKEGRG